MRSLLMKIRVSSVEDATLVLSLKCRNHVKREPRVELCLTSDSHEMWGLHWKFPDASFISFKREGHVEPFLTWMSLETQDSSVPCISSI